VSFFVKHLAFNLGNFGNGTSDIHFETFLCIKAKSDKTRTQAAMSGSDNNSDRRSRTSFKVKQTRQRSPADALMKLDARQPTDADCRPTRVTGQPFEAERHDEDDDDIQIKEPCEKICLLFVFHCFCRFFNVFCCVTVFSSFLLCFWVK